TGLAPGTHAKTGGVPQTIPGSKKKHPPRLGHGRFQQPLRGLARHHVLHGTDDNCQYGTADPASDQLPNHGSGVEAASGAAGQERKDSLQNLPEPNTTNPARDRIAEGTETVILQARRSPITASSPCNDLYDEVDDGALHDASPSPWVGATGLPCVPRAPVVRSSVQIFSGEDNWTLGQRSRSRIRRAWRYEANTLIREASEFRSAV